MEEVSALGAAYLAGLQAGIFKDLADLKKLGQSRKVVPPGKDRIQAGRSYKQYHDYLQMFLKGDL